MKAKSILFLITFLLSPLLGFTQEKYSKWQLDIGTEIYDFDVSPPVQCLALKVKYKKEAAEYYFSLSQGLVNLGANYSYITPSVFGTSTTLTHGYPRLAKGPILGMGMDIAPIWKFLRPVLGFGIERYPGFTYTIKNLRTEITEVFDEKGGFGVFIKAGFQAGPIRQYLQFRLSDDRFYNGSANFSTGLTYTFQTDKKVEAREKYAYIKFPRLENPINFRLEGGIMMQKAISLKNNGLDASIYLELLKKIRTDTYIGLIADDNRGSEYDNEYRSGIINGIPREELVENQLSTFNITGIHFHKRKNIGSDADIFYGGGLASYHSGFLSFWKNPVPGVFSSVKWRQSLFSGSLRVHLPIKNHPVFVTIGFGIGLNLKSGETDQPESKKLFKTPTFDH